LRRRPCVTRPYPASGRPAGHPADRAFPQFKVTSAVVGTVAGTAVPTDAADWNSPTEVTSVIAYANEIEDDAVTCVLR
jgi:hypothetical protein